MLWDLVSAKRNVLNFYTKILLIIRDRPGAGHSKGSRPGPMASNGAGKVKWVHLVRPRAHHAQGA